VIPTDARCPDCGSLVRDGMAWCTLCHADLRSPEEKEAARLESSLVLVSGTGGIGSSGPAADEQLPAAADPADAAPVSSRGRHARPSSTTQLPAVLAVAPPAAAAALTHPAASSLDALQAATAAAAAESEAKLAELRQAGIDVDGMFQMLAADKSADPLTGFVQQRLGSKGSRAVAILVASAALTSLGILVMYVLGSVFG
jgi:hypothetical protein